jgi:hypothetical protein
MTASACSAALGHANGGVVHRSSCRLHLVVSVWLDVLNRPRVDGGRWMGVGRVDRETAGAVIGRQRLVPLQVDYGMGIARIRYGNLAEDAWPSQLSSRFQSAS